MGVTTTGPVRAVPIIGPPWNSNGGGPLAGALMLCAAQPVFGDTACVMPAMWPTFATLRPVELQASSDGRCVAGRAEAPAASRATMRRPDMPARIAAWSPGLRDLASFTMSSDVTPGAPDC